jgi:hypothetical protein
MLALLRVVFPVAKVAEVLTQRTALELAVWLLAQGILNHCGGRASPAALTEPTVPM